MTADTPATRLGRLIGQVREWPSVLWRLEARLKGVQFDGRCLFVGRPLISVARGSKLRLGDGMELRSAVRSTPLGTSQPCVLRALAAGAQLILGPGVGLSGAVICAGASIEIGEGTILGSGAMVIDNDFHSPEGEWRWRTDYCAKSRPVRIGRGVFIGARAIILKGVNIGDRAIIGAGAVVTGDVPAGKKAAGNPARILE